MRGKLLKLLSMVQEIIDLSNAEVEPDVLLSVLRAARSEITEVAYQVGLRAPSITDMDSQYATGTTILSIHDDMVGFYRTIQKLIDAPGEELD